MGPSCGRRRASSRRKALFKKESIAGSPERDVINVELSDECSTPRGEEFRIPEVKTCPPAPKKRRTITSCSLRRNPISFFASPDIYRALLLLGPAPRHSGLIDICDGD